MKCLAVIPARYGSTRLPGKVLLPLAGKPIIQHVWERARECRLIDDILVATDDSRIMTAVHAFGGRAVMTSSEHQSGTDRIAEAVNASDHPIIVNLQGDEPLIAPETIEAAISPLLDDPAINMGTACTPVHNVDELFNTNCVKVILDAEGNAIYFSRFPIPFHRLPGTTYDTFREAVANDPLLLKHFYKHVGIYVYQRDFLDIFVNLPESYLERIEKLEQLRVLEHGYKIRVAEVRQEILGVDTEEDYLQLKRRMEVTGKV